LNSSPHLSLKKINNNHQRRKTASSLNLEIFLDRCGDKKRVRLRTLFTARLAPAGIPPQASSPTSAKCVYFSASSSASPLLASFLLRARLTHVFVNKDTAITTLRTLDVPAVWRSESVFETCHLVISVGFYFGSTAGAGGSFSGWRPAKSALDNFCHDPPPYEQTLPLCIASRALQTISALPPSISACGT